MTHHKSEDYKTQAVKYYLVEDNYYWFYKLIKMAIGGKKTISNDDKVV
jgi:hypothetical protein